MDTYELIDVTLTDWLLRMRHGLGEPITCVHYNWHRIRMPYQPGDTNTMTTHTHMGVAITNDARLSMVSCKDEFIMSLQNFNHQNCNRKLLQERLLWLGDGYTVGTRTQFWDKTRQGWPSSSMQRAEIEYAGGQTVPLAMNNLGKSSQYVTSVAQTCISRQKTLVRQAVQKI